MDLNLWKKRKKEMHLNYDKIATQAGISKRTVEDIFRGYTTTPRIDTVEAIESVLGLNQQPKWTEEEKTLGVGKYKTNLSEDEWEWIEIRSEILRIHGEEYLKTVKTMLKAITNNKD